LTVPETARILGIGRHSAYVAVRTGAIPSLRIGKRILVPRQAVERMLAAALQPAPARESR
jgi:excisionase family DNA binding protein